MPLKLKSIINKAGNLLLSEFKDTRAIVVIGSIADKTHNNSSDIDLVWIKNHRIGYKRQSGIENKLNSYTYRKIQLIPFTIKQILWHFSSCSTMAHSIQQGIAIYGQKDRLILNLLKKELSLPTKGWMRHWFKHWFKRYQWAKESIKREKRYHRKFCKEKCDCTVFDDIARVAVNFAILYLETKGVVPVSKCQILKNIKKSSLGLPEDSLGGIKLALKFSGKDKYLTLAQADKILSNANWFKKRLKRCIL